MTSATRADGAIPALVALPHSADEVAAVVRACAEAGVPFVARGSGTGLSGGALPHADGVLIVTAQMRHIVEVALADERVVVQPGVINLDVTRAASPHEYYYAPDPSSQQICSIGGNVAENSGGAHCLKYGFTTNHVTGLEIVTPAGDLVRLGGRAPDPPGYNLVGAFVGSEGTLGIATEVTVRLVRLPEAVQTLLAGFASTDEAGAAVSAIIGGRRARGHRDDGRTGHRGGRGGRPLWLSGRRRRRAHRRAGRVRGRGGRAVRRRGAAVPRGRRLRDPDGGRRRGAGAVLEGSQVGVRRGRPDQPGLHRAGWGDPRTALQEVLRSIADLSRRTGVRVANVFHAGDGNLHPLVLFDDAVEGQSERAEEVSGAILDLCIEHCGSITGEHGVGMDKVRHMPRMFSADDLDTMQLVRCAFDPAGLANPGKVFPT